MALNVDRATSKEEHRIIVLQWARAATPRTDSKILSVPCKLLLHRMQGLNMSKSKKIYFDPTFNNDENIKYRLMHSWPSIEQNKKFVNRREKDRENAHKNWKYSYEVDGRELQLVQNDYFTSAVEIFENIEEVVNDAIHSSSLECFDTAGHRKFEVDDFIAKLHSEDLYPTIHVEYAILTPPGLPTGPYQILKKVKLYLKPHEDVYRRSPDYLVGDVQGNYNPEKPIFLI